MGLSPLLWTFTSHDSFRIAIQLNHIQTVRLQNPNWYLVNYLFMFCISKSDLQITPVIV